MKYWKESKKESRQISFICLQEREKQSNIQLNQASKKNLERLNIKQRLRLKQQNIAFKISTWNMKNHKQINQLKQIQYKQKQKKQEDSYFSFKQIFIQTNRAFLRRMYQTNKSVVVNNNHLSVNYLLHQICRFQDILLLCTDSFHSLKVWL
ncbi:hypothetical protein TTHERM_000509089 (macronuclear) [Tetrahymena thermophila SB210]|uniref:Uncharacterized protein n=1 Tax=Tetrahymena thermophila (strain SB210) TaxID=312017 RepID=W7XB21_TETTS|nr:hypothetical protein TTHERM_000509089 [Tetrahymena thermophila SB210]EWS74537.1 hypothetical protein TTHERM_000509089 [Tetrahymena thermophila SB210]|eukprot:XP_012652911.1 hypothetical protein TTHERM_000509089 [Tetrahymena thermophila SB210]